MMRGAAVRMGFNPDTSGLGLQHLFLLQDKGEDYAKQYAADQQAKAIGSLLKKGVLRMKVSDGAAQ